MARFGWTPITESDGVYLVERAYVPRDEARTTTRRYEVIAKVDSTPGSDGWIEYEERVPYPTMWDTPPCYRVRAVRGEERGPYSAERCALLATDQRPPEGRAPLAPDAGSGGAADVARPSSLNAPVAGGLVAIAGAAAGLAVIGRRTRSRR